MNYGDRCMAIALVNGRVPGSSSSSSSSSIIVRPLSRITAMGGCAHRSGRSMELCLECGDGIRVDAGFRKRVPLRYCSNKKRVFILSSM